MQFPIAAGPASAGGEACQEAAAPGRPQADTPAPGVLGQHAARMGVPPRVPMGAAGRLGPSEQAAITAAITEVVASGELIGGSQVAAFEREFAHFIGVDHCVGVGNGSDALEVALRAVGVGPGDAVVTVANAGFYASAAILAIGALPAYADVDPDHHQMSLAPLETALTLRPAAVVLTHLYGDARQAPVVAAACARAGVPLVEDCAQATGAIVGGRRAGAFGAAAAFSFYPTKPLGAVGDAGAVVTDDPAIAAAARRAANHGWDARFHVAGPGRNSRLDPVQAAVLRLRLPGVDEAAARRRRIRQRYADALASSDARLVGAPGAAGHAAHLAVLEVADAPAVRERLGAAGIATDVHYPVPDHKQRRWEHVRRSAPGASGASDRANSALDRSGTALSPMVAGTPDGLSVTESLMGRILTVPCFDGMTDAEVEAVADALSACVASSPVGTPRHTSPDGSSGGAAVQAGSDAAAPTTRVVPLTVVGQERGHLVAGEVPEGVPFVPARFFLVSGVPAGQVRGQHAHRSCSQLLVAAAGELTVRYVDADGAGQVRLAATGPALLIPPGIYAEQCDHTPDAVLLVLADEPYDPDGYLPG